MNKASIVVAVSFLVGGIVAAPAAEMTRAVAVLHPASGSEVQGVVTFTQVADGVRVVADVTGLTPGPHGFHIHQFGDCTAADGTSAGGHFNPTGHAHGGPDAAERHVGDLGNLVAAENGKAHYDRVDTRLELTGAHAIVGAGVIVHEKVDDLTTQPTGAAGARIACGVIGSAKE